MYYKEQLVYKDGKISKAIIRNYRESDFNSLISIQRECFPPPFPEDLLWNEEQLASHLAHYPEGALCIEVEGELAGSLTGMLLDLKSENHSHSWDKVTDRGYISTHQPNGKSFYIVDIGVKPAYRKMDLGKMLMQAAYERVIADRLERVIGGGRMPGFKRFSKEMTAQQYAKKVLAGELKDPVITFLMRNGRMPVSLVENYLEDDDSQNFALLMEWKNPFMPYKQD